MCFSILPPFLPPSLPLSFPLSIPRAECAPCSQLPAIALCRMFWESTSWSPLSFLPPFALASSELRQLAHTFAAQMGPCVIPSVCDELSHMSRKLRELTWASGCQEEEKGQTTKIPIGLKNHVITTRTTTASQLHACFLLLGSRTLLTKTVPANEVSITRNKSL